MFLHLFSQSSAATQLRCDDIFSDLFDANRPQSGLVTVF